MHRFTLAFTVTAALIISGPAYAQHAHGGGKPTTSPSTNHTPSTTSTNHGNSGSHATTTGTNTHTSNATHGNSGDTHGASTKHASPANTTTTANTKKPSNAASGSNTTTLTAVQQKLQKNTNLTDKLRTRLPQGTDLMKASDGFKNLGQFVAAVNVSSNHPDVKFADLKTRMVDQGMSLGQALQSVKKMSNSSAQTEVQRAETEANEMIKSTTATSNATTTKKK